jgi:hypothetical protein
MHPSAAVRSMCPVLQDRLDVSVMEGTTQPERSSQMRDRSESAIRTGLFARLALIAAVAYQLLLIGLILLRPEIDPARKPISEYAIGRLGWLAVLAFQVSATAYACLVVALRPMLRDRVGRIGLVVLCYCAVATVVVGLCVADPVTTPMTELSVVGGVHVIAGTSAFLLLPVAALMINISLSRTAGLAGSRMLLIVTGLLPSIGLVICTALVATVTPSEGWPPRLMFLTYAAWIVAVAISMWHRSPADLHLVRT